MLDDAKSYLKRKAQTLGLERAEILKQIQAMLDAQKNPVRPSAFQFTKNLKLGDTDADVQKLQQFLNTHGFPLALSGFGSPGRETIRFAVRTYTALVRFQEAHAVEILAPFGLTKGTGFFGNFTRRYVNSLLKEPGK